MAPWGVVLLTASVTMLSRLWEGDLHGDQVLYASIAQGITQRGDWLSLHWGGDPYWKKPPLMFWLVASASEALGPTSLAARLFPALFGVLSCLAIYALAKRLFDDTTAFLAGVVLATTPRFFRNAAGLSLDPAVSFFTVLAVLFYVRAVASAAWRDFALAGAAWGLAVMAKGAFGLLGPAVFLLYVAVERRWRVLASPGFLVSLVVGAAVCLPWHVHQLVTWGPAFLRVYLGEEVMDRMTGELELDVGPISYPAALVRENWPWIVFVLVGLWVAVGCARRGDRSAQFILAWTVGFFVLINLSRIGRVQYLLQLYPPLAIVTALGVRAVLPGRWVAALPRAFAAVAVVAGMALNVLPLTLHRPRYDELRALAPVLDRLTPSGAPIQGHRTSIQLRSASLVYLGRDIERIAPTEVRPGMVVLSERNLVSALERAGLERIEGNERYALYRTPGVAAGR